MWSVYSLKDIKCGVMNFLFQAIMHHEGHMDDGLTLSRSQHEESRTARVIRSTVFLFNLFIRWVTHIWSVYSCPRKRQYKDNCTKDINTASAVRQRERQVQRAQSASQSHTYKKTHTDSSHGYRKQHLLQIEQLPLIAETEQNLDNCLVFRLERLLILKPFTTDQWARLPNKPGLNL